MMNKEKHLKHRLLSCIFIIGMVALLCSCEHDNCNYVECYCKDHEFKSAYDYFLSQELLYYIELSDSQSLNIVATIIDSNGDVEDRFYVCSDVTLELLTEKTLLPIGLNNNFNEEMYVDSFILAFPGGIRYFDLSGVFHVSVAHNLLTDKVENVDTGDEFDIFSISYENAKNKIWSKTYIFSVEIAKSS